MGVCMFRVGSFEEEGKNMFKLEFIDVAPKPLKIRDIPNGRVFKYAGLGSSSPGPYWKLTEDIIVRLSDGTCFSAAQFPPDLELFPKNTVILTL